MCPVLGRQFGVWQWVQSLRCTLCTLTVCLSVLNLVTMTNSCANDNCSIAESTITTNLSELPTLEPTVLIEPFSFTSELALSIIQNLSKSQVEEFNRTNQDIINFLQQDQFRNESYSTQDEQPQSNSLALMAFWPWQALLVTLYSTTALFSFLLNSVTIWVLSKSDRTISNELSKFLINLSVADIGLSLFCIPFTYTQVMFQEWVFPEFLCPIVNFAQICSVFVSVWTLTVIGIDRYFAIIHPLCSLHKLRSYKLLIICFIWSVGSLVSLPMVLVSKIERRKRLNQMQCHCTENWSHDVNGQIYTGAIFVITFILPILILSFVYSKISYRIMRHVTPGNPDSFRDRQQNNRKFKVLNMLIRIVFLFFVCWLPIQLFNMWIYFWPNVLQARSHSSAAIFYTSFFVTHLLSMAHGLINPMLYCFMSQNFRKNLCHVLGRCSARIKNCESINTTITEEVPLEERKGRKTVDESGNQTYTSYSKTRRNLSKMSTSQSEGNNEQMNNNNNQVHHQNHLHCHPSSIRAEKLSNGSSSNSHPSLPIVQYLDVNNHQPNIRKDSSPFEMSGSRQH